MRAALSTITEVHFFHHLREVLRLAAKVTGRMRAARVAGRTVTLTVRFADFTTITRTRTLPEA